MHAAQHVFMGHLSHAHSLRRCSGEAGEEGWDSPWGLGNESRWGEGYLRNKVVLEFLKEVNKEPWVPTAWVSIHSWVDRGGCLAESMSSWGWGYSRQVTEGKKSMYQGRSQPGLRNRDNSSA